MKTGTTKCSRATLIRYDRLMKRFQLTFLMAYSFAFFCVSCKEDPKIVEQRAKQKVEIARLNGDLAEIELGIRNLPSDMSEDLEKARKTAQRKTVEVMNLETEVSGLSAQQRVLQADFYKWRVKHPIK